MSGKQATGFWRRPTMVKLVWSLWFALLFGLPPVLTLPSALPADGIALSFSSSRALMAFAILVGRAMAFSFPAFGAKPSRAIRLAGVAATLTYVSLLGFSFACELSVDAGVAVCLSFIGPLLSAFAAFSCSLALPSSCEGRPVEKPARVTLSVVVFAAAAAAALLLSVGREPCLTLARVSFAYSSPTAGSEWWRVLVYDLAGVVGPGANPLRFGTAGFTASQLLVVCGWFVVGALAVHVCRPHALPGIAMGVLACRWALSCVGVDAAVFVPLGLLFGVLALVLLAVDFLRGGEPGAEVGEDGESLALAPSDARLDVLSSREREAVEGRIRGLSSAEIAEQMGIQPSTVRNLQARAAAKLGVTSLDLLAGGRGNETVESLVEEPVKADTVQVKTLFGLVSCMFVVLLLARVVFGGTWIAQELLGEAIVSFALLAVGVGFTTGTLWRSDALITASWAFIAIQLGFIAAVLTSVEASVPPLALVLALVAVVADVLLLSRGHLSRAWGITVRSFALSMGLGLMFGAWVAWPLAGAQWLFAIRDATSGLIVISAIAGFMYGAVLLLGLVAAFYTSFACRAHEELEAKRLEGKKGLEPRAKAFYASRGLNGTQSDVAWCALNGVSREQIGRELNLSLGAVNSAKREAYRALGIHSVAELIRVTLRAVG